MTTWAGSLTVGASGDLLPANVRSLLTSLSVRASTTSIPEMTVELHDPMFGQLALGRWDKGITLAWEGWSMVIDEWEIPGGTVEQVSVKALDVVGAALKAQEGGKAWRTASATNALRDVVEEAAGAIYGPAATVKGAVARRGGDNPESSWDMGSRLATELDWRWFVVDGVAVFAPADWLADNPLDGQVWAITYGWFGSGLRPLEVPACRSSNVADDAATVEVQLVWDEARDIRPGHAAEFSGIDRFAGRYLVTSVDQTAGREQPVRVGLTQPKPPKKRAGS